MRPHASLPSVVAEVIFKLVALVTQIKSLPWDVALHHFETFAGCKAAGRYAISHDITYNERTMNILGSLGYCNALFECLRLAPGSGKLT
ncbi:nipblb, partial [Symbiodinium microadriaticum]